MSYIKLTSFESWVGELPRGCHPDLLVNTDHVLRITTADRGTTFGVDGPTYKATLLTFADKVVKIAETPEYFYEAWAVGEGSVHRDGNSYVRGVRTDDWGNPISDEAAVQQ